MNEKIIQIIPAPAELTAYFEESNCSYGICDHRDGPHTAYSRRIVCLALVERFDERIGLEQEVRPMVIDSTGDVVFAEDHGCLVEVEYA